MLLRLINFGVIRKKLAKNSIWEAFFVSGNTAKNNK